MVICPDCGREMLEAATCTIAKFAFPDGSIFPRIPFGSENPPWQGERCHDCGVERGGYHHPGCDVERCPACLQQAIACACPHGETESSHGDGGPPWVDVPAAIEITSRSILQHPGFDWIYIDPVATCGHVGKGHLREMVRGDELPLDDWFRLGGWMGADTAAVLFTCRAKSLENLSEDDLDVGRKIAAYAETNAELPWELVYVTRQGNFRASDLLGLPGPPQFEPCTYIPWEELSNRLGL